jgi:hypothetical protein
MILEHYIIIGLCLFLAVVIRDLQNANKHNKKLIKTCDSAIDLCDANTLLYHQMVIKVYEGDYELITDIYSKLPNSLKAEYKAQQIEANREQTAHTSE